MRTGHPAVLADVNANTSMLRCPVRYPQDQSQRSLAGHDEGPTGGVSAALVPRYPMVVLYEVLAGSRNDEERSRDDDACKMSGCRGHCQLRNPGKTPPRVRLTL